MNDNDLKYNIGLAPSVYHTLCKIFCRASIRHFIYAWTLDALSDAYRKFQLEYNLILISIRVKQDFNVHNPTIKHSKHELYSSWFWNFEMNINKIIEENMIYRLRVKQSY